MRRKRRALAWAGDARAIRTAERNAKECWYPAFLAAAELYLRDGMTGSSSPEELGPVTETNPTDNQDIIDNLSRSASDLPLGYIRREHEEAQLRELIAQKARIIAIVGQPGMGKSWLAMALLAIGLPGSTPVIRFERGQIYLPDLRAALDDAGVKGGGKNPDKTETDLVRLLCSKRAPQFVVLDNLTSTSELTFIPSHARSTIIATCRTSDDSKPLSCQLVRIGAMTQAEALTLVRSRLPSLDDQSSNAVVEAFDRHPLVISIACGLLELDAVSVEELCRSITDQAGDATTSGETLREIFGRMIEALKQRDRLATAALTFLSFVGDVPEIDLRVLRRYLRAVRSSVTPYEFVKALKLLTHLCLVDIVAGAASMHIVTRSVLHDIFHERFDFVVDRTLLMLHEYQQGRVPHLVGEVDLQEMWSLNLVMISVASQVVRRAEEDGEFRALRRSLVELAMLITQVAEEYRLRSSALARDLGFEMDPHWEQWLRERLPSLDTD